MSGTSPSESESYSYSSQSSLQLESTGSAFKGRLTASSSLRILRAVRASRISLNSSSSMHNEVVITNGLSVINQLQPKIYDLTKEMYDASYNGTVENSRVSSGFIAQEVQQITDISYCVRDTNIRNDDGEIIEERPLAINYTELLS